MRRPVAFWPIETDALRPEPPQGAPATALEVAAADIDTWQSQALTCGVIGYVTDY
jgi:hypothetical protein